MTDETPKTPRKRSPHLLSVDTVVVRFTLQALPVDAESLARERKGRPEHSPSLAPEDPKPTDDTPPAA